MTTSTTKKAPRATGLSKALVLDCATEIVRDCGARDLTMRLLADRLGFSGMASYRHIGSRSDIFWLLIERAFASVPDDPTSLGNALVDLYSALRAYDGLEHEIPEDITYSPIVIAWRDRIATSVGTERADAALWLVFGALTAGPATDSREADRRLTVLATAGDALARSAA